MKELHARLEKLDKLNEALAEAAFEVAEGIALDMESYAKQNKKWTPRTNDAVLHLQGRALKKKDGVASQIWQNLYGATGKEYGYYLEKARRFHGKYAILQETQESFAREFLLEMAEALKGAVKKL